VFSGFLVCRTDKDVKFMLFVNPARAPCRYQKKDNYEPEYVGAAESEVQDNPLDNCQIKKHQKGQGDR
jgi:hypothetical protein